MATTTCTEKRPGDGLGIVVMVAATPLLMCGFAVIAMAGAWWMFLVLLAVGAPLVFAHDRVRAHAREIWQVQVLLRKDARVKRAMALKYPTYIRRWYPERRMRHMHALHKFDVLLEAMVEESRLRSGAWIESPKQLPSCVSSTTAKQRTSSKRSRDARGRFLSER